MLTYIISTDAFVKESWEQHIPYLRLGYNSLFELLRDIPELACGFNSTGAPTICSGKQLADALDEQDEGVTDTPNALVFSDADYWQERSYIKEMIVAIIRRKVGGITTKQLQGKQI